MGPNAPALPGIDEWRRFGIEIVEELHAGKQSRVFEARLDGTRVAVKLTDAALASADLQRRLELVESLPPLHAGVVAPIRIDGSLLTPIASWLMSATPFIEGRSLADDNTEDAELLGAEMARLHEVLKQHSGIELPAVAALDTPGVERGSDWQLLHGDFSTKNVIETPVGVQVFDFDECGYGPTEYDVANSLYMVLFDARVSDRPSRFEVFRPAFLTGYRSVASWPVSEEAIEGMIQIRIEALARWLADLSSAPIGIRTATSSWLQTLEKFVQDPTLL